MLLRTSYSLPFFHVCQFALLQFSIVCLNCTNLYLSIKYTPFFNERVSCHHFYEIHTLSAYSDAICCIWSLCIPTILPTALAVSLPCKHKVFKLMVQARFSDCKHHLRDHTSNISAGYQEQIKLIFPPICYSKTIYLAQSSRRHSTHQCFNAFLKIQQYNESIKTFWKQASMWHAIIAKANTIY